MRSFNRTHPIPSSSFFYTTLHHPHGSCRKRLANRIPHARHIWCWSGVQIHYSRTRGHVKRTYVVSLERKWEDKKGFWTRTRSLESYYSRHYHLHTLWYGLDETLVSMVMPLLYHWKEIGNELVGCVWGGQSCACVHDLDCFFYRTRIRLRGWTWLWDKRTTLSI